MKCKDLSLSPIFQIIYHPQIQRHLKPSNPSETNAFFSKPLQRKHLRTPPTPPYRSTSVLGGFPRTQLRGASPQRWSCGTFPAGAEPAVRLEPLCRGSEWDRPSLGATRRAVFLPTARYGRPGSDGRSAGQSSVASLESLVKQKEAVDGLPPARM